MSTASTASMQPLPAPTTLAEAYDFVQRRRAEVGVLVEGHQRELDLLTICFSVLGHALLVGPSGTSKTRTARAFAQVFGLSFGRIQGSADLLPSGITGYHREVLGNEEFVRGPIFHGLVFFDELPRSPEYSKSALLEPLEEGHATSDGRTYRVPAPGILVATMNPADAGTYPLLHPERERFLLHVPFDFLSAADALDWLTHFDRYDAMPHVPDGEENASTQQNAAALAQLRQVIVHGIGMSQEMLAYAVALIHTIRQHGAVSEPCGDRAISHLFMAAKATALFQGHESVWPDDIHDIAESALGHRITTDQDRGDFAAGREIVAWALSQVPVPHSPVAPLRR